MDKEKLWMKLQEIIDDSAKTDQVMNVLLGIEAEYRQSRSAAQRQGIEKAKENGVRFGRPKNPIPKGFNKVYDLYSKQMLSSTLAARALGVSVSTFFRLVRQYRNELENIEQ